ncbi:hypothetical protein EJ05DRAFT_37152 [Pseudovirgaria hyperparasitica]|uniref:Rhodopsin domain-containing protein n=1 Tax=Pseudovirgaria hyperparasitica TaxID=470096 RepID=A0A6A6WMF4_9PEZI|nr:uncharacterized protein EJ05DRAFT_37152 [Pseudovirgaria hyperparasitica]KAF2763384.1 hypothetical protein EJ05DRAFT_37152 [Pseudovirgaria hyperparasitica]
MTLLPLAKSELAACITVLSLATIAVALRMVARFTKRLRLGIDDYLIIFCWLMASGLCGSGIYAGATNLHARPIKTRTLDQFIAAAKINFTNILLWYLCFGLIKISVLVFYQRLFTFRRFKILSNILIGIIVLWMLCAELLFLARRKPSLFWNYTVQISDAKKPKKIDFENWMLANACINTSLDIAVLCFPLPVIRSLHMGRAKKTLLFFVFGSGAFCVVASAVTLSYRVKAATIVTISDGSALVTWNVVWGNIEVCSSIVAACLPTLAPLFEVTQGILNSIRSRLASLSLSWSRSRSVLQDEESLRLNRIATGSKDVTSTAAASPRGRTVSEKSYDSEKPEPLSKPQNRFVMHANEFDGY